MWKGQREGRKKLARIWCRETSRRRACVRFETPSPPPPFLSRTHRESSHQLRRVLIVRIVIVDVVLILAQVHLLALRRTPASSFARHLFSLDSFQVSVPRSLGAAARSRAVAATTPSPPVPEVDLIFFRDGGGFRLSAALLIRRHLVCECALRALTTVAYFKNNRKGDNTIYG